MDKPKRRRPAALGKARTEPGTGIYRACWSGIGLCLLLSGCAGESVSNAGNAPAAAPTVGSAAPASDRQKVLGPFTLEVPSGWVEQTPRSRMRRAQFALPRESGDSEDGELTVFYFGMGQGGSTDANINRWIGQVGQPDGSSSRAKAKIRESDVSGFRMTEVDVSGTLKASNMPGAPQRPARTGYRLMGAVLESPQGPWFFKLVGPEKTIARWAESFRQFIASAKSQ